MRNEELIRKLRRYAEQYRSGETLGRVIEDTEDLLEEAADRLENLETTVSLMPEGISLEDSSAHVIFNYSQEGDVSTQTQVQCPRCRSERLRVRYHEDRLYGVVCYKCRILTLVKAGNPFKAAEIVGDTGIGETVEVIEKDGERPEPAAQLNDSESICPICGETITYDGGMDRDDSGCTYPWSCEHCGATGEEGFDFVFDRHYNVRDRDGKPIPGRPE